LNNAPMKDIERCVHTIVTQKASLNITNIERGFRHLDLLFTFAHKINVWEKES